MTYRPEYIQIGPRGIYSDGDVLKAQLVRAYASEAQAHEEGLWCIANAPYSTNDMARPMVDGLEVWDCAFKLPAMSATDTEVTVSQKVAFWFDVGTLLRPVTVIE